MKVQLSAPVPLLPNAPLGVPDVPLSSFKQRTPSRAHHEAGNSRCALMWTRGAGSAHCLRGRHGRECGRFNDTAAVRSSGRRPGPWRSRGRVRSLCITNLTLFARAHPGPLADNAENKHVRIGKTTLQKDLCSCGEYTLLRIYTDSGYTKVTERSSMPRLSAERSEPLYSESLRPKRRRT